MSGDTTPPHPSPLPKGARGLVFARRKVVSQLDAVCVGAADVQAYLTPLGTTDDRPARSILPPLLSRGEGWGEGTDIYPAHDLCQNAIHVLQHIQIAEAQHLEALAPQVGGAHAILGQSGLVIVLAAVEFDHQMQFGAVEVQHIRRAGMLSTKLQPRQASIA